MNIRKNLDGNRLWFYADPHFFHRRIGEYDSQFTFNNVNEMNEAIVNNHNKVVQAQDIVYILGDVSLGRAKETEELLSRLNGKLVLIKGNHESTVMKSASCRSHFVEIVDYLEITVVEELAPRGRNHINLFHYSIHQWNMIHHGAWHLHGHSHGKDNYDKTLKIMNVGIMLNNYRPFSYQQIKAVMDTRKVGSHH
jgi:calcineurin-like phosphoesterase family protein